jgi:hypothetical protein
MSQFQQYNVYDGLTACRLVATSNQSGTYVNGPLNNGVGATFTYATGALTIDSVTVNVGDSIAFVAQTAANQNGIYICTQAGATGVSAILQRRADFQCIEQLKIGQFCTIGAGTVSAGSEFVLVEPLPQRFGIDNLVFTAAIPAGQGTASTKAATNNSLPDLASTAGSGFTSGDIVTAADTAGTIQDSGILATNIVRKDSTNTMAAGSSIVLAKVNGTEAANAVTASGVAGLLTTSSLTTAGGASYAITWTNTFITATSAVMLQLAGGTNTTENITLKAVPGSGTCTVTIYNNTAATALNGTILLSYAVF